MWWWLEMIQHSHNCSKVLFEHTANSELRWTMTCRPLLILQVWQVVSSDITTCSCQCLHGKLVCNMLKGCYIVCLWYSALKQWCQYIIHVICNIYVRSYLRFHFFTILPLFTGLDILGAYALLCIQFLTVVVPMH